MALLHPENQVPARRSPGHRIPIIANSESGGCFHFLTLSRLLVSLRPKNGSIILYNRKKVKYRKDGYCWKKRKDGKTTREDHMKLKVQGMEVCGQVLLSLSGVIPQSALMLSERQTEKLICSYSDTWIIILASDFFRFHIHCFQLLQWEDLHLFYLFIFSNFSFSDNDLNVFLFWMTNQKKTINFRGNFGFQLTVTLKSCFF